MAKNSGQFKKGQHWRSSKPFWSREWLDNEYTKKGRSSADIAAQFGVRPVSILFWIKKHGIKTRSVSEARKQKHWGATGASNPMYGRRGVLNPNWKGGRTPWRQEIYAQSSWKKFARAVRKRDKSCRLCGCDEKTEIHHIDPFSEAPLLVMDMGNAILLCQPCHRKMRGKEQRWKKRLLKLLEQERR